MSKTSSFEEYLRPVAASVPPELISPSAFSDIDSVARVLPGTFGCNTFGFECRLAEELPRADFLVLATASRGRDSLANLHPTSPLPARLLIHPIWKRVKDFAVHWADPSSPLYRAVDNVWLEFDVDGRAPDLPLPSVFFAPRPTGQEDIGESAYEANLDAYEMVVAEVIQLLTGKELGPQVLKMLSGCLRSLSSDVQVFQIGVMLSRAAEATRLCLRLSSPEHAVEYLRRVGWQGSEAGLRSILEPLSGLVDYFCLNVDVGESVHPKIGLECYFNGRKQPKREPRWGSFLDSLVLGGLCTHAKRDALLAYPGYVDENAEGIPWPAALRRVSHLLGGRSLSTFVRSLHHVKIVYQPGEGLEAKAYLAVNHHWHTPALRG